jgi:peptide deformylase
MVIELGRAREQGGLALAELPIRVVGDPVLRRKAARVAKVDASIQALIDDMIETMRAAGGVGLAAPQIGRSLRVVVIEAPQRLAQAGADPEEEMEPPKEGADEVIVLVNPQIVRRTGQRQVTEGCLSVPGYWGEITRALKVTVKGLNREGREVRVKGEELLAQALEHEIDHINGVLYIDYLESVDQLMKVEPKDESETPPKAKAEATP